MVLNMTIKRFSLFLTCFFAVMMVMSCASTNVTTTRSYVDDETFARPKRILVYDFAATPADVSAYSVVAGRYAQYETVQTSEEIERGRALASQVAEALVADFQNMGLPAMRAADRSGPPQVGDMIISGEFVSINWGSRGMRMTIGFGAGRSELRTVVEGYMVTKYGLRPFKSREIEARGDSMPGLLLPVAVGGPVGLVIGGTAQWTGETGSRTITHIAQQTANVIARELEVDFKQVGWI